MVVPKDTVLTTIFIYSRKPTPAVTHFNTY